MTDTTSTSASVDDSDASGEHPVDTDGDTRGESDGDTSVKTDGDTSVKTDGDTRGESDGNIGLETDGGTEGSTEGESDGDTSPDEDLLSGRYRLIEPLGEGAMGKVYRAEHVLMEKTVAIKVLRGEMTDNDEMVARFQREARAAAALEHPNVCQATDFGQRDDGSFFLVMQFLEGRTLEETLRIFGRLDTERALDVARQIADALQTAHRKGIVHRDLKPENIMLVDRQDDDTVKIMDFGIARILAATGDSDDDGDADDETRLTREGMVYGTPHYMSPEQVAGDDVDATTDLYALGIILFEMLTGEPPFDGDNIARIMGKHITEPIPALDDRTSQQNYPAALQQLVERLLAKDLDARPRSAREVIEAIDAIDLDGDGPSTTARVSTEVSEQLRDGATGLVDAVGPATDRLAPAASRLTSMIGVGANGIGAHLRAAVTGVAEFWTGLPRLERRIAAGLSTAFVLGVVLVFTVFSLVFSADRQAAAIDDHQQQLLEDDDIANAVDEARSGDRTALDDLIDQRDGDPHLRYLALMADLEAHRSVDLADEAKQILELDGRYAHDPELVDELLDNLRGDDDIEALLADHMSSTIREELAERAHSGSRQAVRNTAYEFLNEYGEFEALAPWQQRSAELRQTYNCSELEEILDDLRRFGDPRAIPALEGLQSMRTRGCGTLNLQDCIGCVRAELGDVIDELSED